jgi:hypothetical protein
MHRWLSLPPIGCLFSFSVQPCSPLQPERRPPRSPRIGWIRFTAETVRRVFICPSGAESHSPTRPTSSQRMAPLPMRRPQAVALGSPCPSAFAMTCWSAWLSHSTPGRPTSSLAETATWALCTVRDFPTRRCSRTIATWEHWRARCSRARTSRSAPASVPIRSVRRAGICLRWRASPRRGSAAGCARGTP